MIVLNGTEHMPMMPTGFDLVSVMPEKIVLPYIGKLWGDIYWEVMKLIFIKKNAGEEGADYCFEKEVDQVSISMSFNIQRTVVRPTAYIKAKLCSGESVDGRLLIQAERAEIQSVLDAFFNLGGRGLGAAYIPHYRETYKQWVSGQNS